ncbi:MAG: GGDEF domain-containing protein [gamma proteobacterium symbiont of Taylorina sp.]|nr:GGDEF domain-containing protein [gamma proteobacterium symbiont of Taylorina sp.]
MKQLNNIDFIEKLAESTRHFDQEDIKKSLLETLDRFSGASDYQLYRVHINSSATTLSLIALKKNHIIKTFRNGKKTAVLVEYLLPDIIKAISSHSIVIIPFQNASGKFHYIYPYYNKENDIFSVLIQDCTKVNTIDQKLIQNLFILYSNYLSLMDKVKRDKLTNLLNRETLDTEITRILSDVQYNEVILTKKYANITEQREDYAQCTYWLGLLDIDFFKNINDSYGHLYGDDVLILVAQLIVKTVRSFDLVFRYGGEEFVVLLKSSNQDIATTAFERIRNEVENYHFAKIKQLTISIGFTQVSHQSGTSEIIGNADQALYFAKENGRNQTCCYEDLIHNRKITSTESIDENIKNIDFF